MALSSTAFDWHGHESWVRLCGFEPRGEPSTALIDGALGVGYRKRRRIQILLGGQANDVVAWPVCRQTASTPSYFILCWILMKFKFKLGRVDRWVERKLSANSFLVQCFCCGWFDFHSEDFSTWVSLSQLLRSCHVFKFNVCLPAKWLYQTRVFNTACF